MNTNANRTKSKKCIKLIIINNLGGGLVLHSETRHAGDDELAALLELEHAHGLQGRDGGLALLAREAGLDTQVVEELGLVQKLALGLNRLHLLLDHGCDDKMFKLQ